MLRLERCALSLSVTIGSRPLFAVLIYKRTTYNQSTTYWLCVAYMYINDTTEKMHYVVPLQAALQYPMNRLDSLLNSSQKYN